MENTYQSVASERVDQAVASKRVFDQLYPPPIPPKVDDSDSKQTKRYLWILYVAAVIFSAVHTIPGLLEKVPEMVLFGSFTLKHLAGGAAFVAYEVGLVNIPYIIFRYLVDNAEGVKKARDIMRRSLWATLGLIVVVLIMLNIYTTLGTAENSNSENTVNENAVLASLETSATPGGEINIMWSIVAVSPVFIAVVSGMGLALIKSTQQAKMQAAQVVYDSAVKDHNKEFRQWDSTQQRHKKGAYSTLSNGQDSGRTMDTILSMSSRNNGRNYNKRTDAWTTVWTHLENNPDDVKSNVRELAERLKVGKSTVSNVQREFRRQL